MSEHEEIASRLAARLEREPDVVVAYLFGSIERGTSGPLSDVDVGILLREGADPAGRHLELIAAVGDVAGSRDADVVILNRAPIALAYRVLRDGRLVLVRDDRARLAFHTSVVDRYLDMEPLRRALAAGIRHRLEEGRFGRR